MLLTNSYSLLPYQTSPRTTVHIWLHDLSDVLMAVGLMAHVLMAVGLSYATSARATLAYDR